MTIAAAIPWREILRLLPLVVATAEKIWKQVASKPKEPPVDPNADAKSQVATLAERLIQIEATQTEQAKLMSLVAEQLQGIARRAAMGYWLGLSGLVLSCLALVILLLRS